MLFRETLRKGAGEQLEISGRLLHSDGKQHGKSAVARGAVRGDDTTQPTCRNVIVHVKNKRASPGTCRRWESLSECLSGAVPSLGRCSSKRSAPHSWTWVVTALPDCSHPTQTADGWAKGVKSSSTRRRSSGRVAECRLRSARFAPQQSGSAGCRDGFGGDIGCWQLSEPKITPKSPAKPVGCLFASNNGFLVGKWIKCMQ